MKDNTRVFNCDCLPAMKEFPDKYFDLAIVDPPYGIGEDGRKTKGRAINKNGKLIHKIDSRNGSKIIVRPKNYHRGEWDKYQPNDIYFDELFRVSKNQIIWGANHFGYLSPSSCWLVWDKCNGTTDFADCELAWTSFNTAVRKFVFMWSGFKQGKSISEGHIMQGNMTLNENRIHPTQKPVALYKWLLKNYAKEGDKILDTHLGSGSSRIAAFDGGFDFTGYELDKDYFEAAEKRFQNHKAQLKFDFSPGAAS